MARDVVVYTTAYCPYCRAAKEFLKAKKVEFGEIDVTEDAEARRELVRKTGGRETVPQIFADGRLVGGYDDLVALYRKGGAL